MSLAAVKLEEAVDSPLGFNSTKSKPTILFLSATLRRRKRTSYQESPPGSGEETADLVPGKPSRLRGRDSWDHPRIEAIGIYGDIDLILEAFYHFFHPILFPCAHYILCPEDPGV